MSAPIQIDGFEFTLIRKWFDERLFVNVQSTSLNTGETTDFWVYASFSELGFWRLGVYDGGILYKGNDYVQSSLIHILLQQHINANLNSLPSVVDFESEEIISQCVCHKINSLSYKLITPECRKHMEQIQNSIDSDDRIMDINPFSGFASRAKCGSPVNNRLLEQISHQVQEAYNYNESSLMPICEHSYIFNDNKDSETYTISISGKIYRVELITNHSKHESEYPILHLYCFIGTLQNISKIQSSGFSRNLNTICEKPTHTFPVLLTTTDVSINKYGLYDKYVPAGAFICKLFDYHRQCEGANDTNKCTPTYTYIGDRYENMFPYISLLRIFKRVSQCTKVSFRKMAKIDKDKFVLTVLRKELIKELEDKILEIKNEPFPENGSEYPMLVFPNDPVHVESSLRGVDTKKDKDAFVMHMNDLERKKGGKTRRKYRRCKKTRQNRFRRISRV